VGLHTTRAGANGNARKLRNTSRDTPHVTPAILSVRAMTSDDVSLPPLPSVLADQVELIRAQFDPQGQTSAEALLRLVDAGVLNLCEYAQVDMDLMNRVMGLRAAAEGLAQTLADPASAAATPADALARARGELDALEAVLRNARPAPLTVALGLGW
jgi:hypothetical protein